ncbi:hypothetical protein Rs2_30003 [Raphanus sativus]|nr:hypothetical protein Rs2_30003 [Raphanus sativus]
MLCGCGGCSPACSGELLVDLFVPVEASAFGSRWVVSMMRVSFGGEIYTRGSLGVGGPGRMATVKRRQVLGLGLTRLCLPLCLALGCYSRTYMVFVFGWTWHGLDSCVF